MASSSSSVLLILFSVLCLSAIAAQARPGRHFHPCKTLFISYTISSYRPQFQSIDDPNKQNPTGFFTIYREINEFEPKPFYPSSEIFIDRPNFPQSVHFNPTQKPQLPEPFPVGVNSLRERTKDILSVVVALLFGVGCGALTSAVMYLIWSLIANRCEMCDSNGVDEEEVNPKDMGYVKIPATATKEGYEGN